MANKQTVWLSTMMILSLMLIGYYTVGQNIQPIPSAQDTLGKDGTTPAKEEAGQTGNGEKTSPQTESSSQPSSQGPQAQGDNSSDFFVAYQLEEKRRLSQELAQLQEKIANEKTPADEVAKAQKKMEELQSLADKQSTIVQLIQAEGFPDAIVTQEENGSYKVIVQAQDLRNDQVVKILSIVKEQLNAPASQVTVSYHP